MAPRETPKATPKAQRATVKQKSSKGKASPAGVIKKTMSVRKTADKIPLKVPNTVEVRQRTSTVPKVSTPKPKENKSVPLPNSVVKSAKKSSWKCRPKPAHSGVPVPEKMKKLLQKQFDDSDSL